MQEEEEEAGHRSKLFFFFLRQSSTLPSGHLECVRTFWCAQPNMALQQFRVSLVPTNQKKLCLNGTATFKVFPALFFFLAKQQVFFVPRTNTERERDTLFLGSPCKSLLFLSLSSPSPPIPWHQVGAETEEDVDFFSPPPSPEKGLFLSFLFLLFSRANCGVKARWIERKKERERGGGERGRTWP